MNTTDLERIFGGLAEAGLEVAADPGIVDGEVVVWRRGRGDGAPTTVVQLPEDLLTRYLEDVRDDHNASNDPHDSAVGTVIMLLVEILTKDRGHGYNTVTWVGLRRGRDGQLTLSSDESSLRPQSETLPPGKYRWTA